jgi:hypothetical protein
MADTQPIIGVHLDLKGIVFKPGYIPELMRDLAAQGINAVLVEYEDVFPFDGMDIAFDKDTAWSKKTLARFRVEAAKHGIEIIPLQQCLGHLEYLFRWKKYLKYAEDKKYPSTLSLTDAKGKALVKEMLRQVLAAHPESRYVHLGMDEAHGMFQAAERLGRPVLELFVEWLNELLEVVEAAGKTAIIWSDMLEDHYLPGRFDKIKDRVVLCLWDYASQGERGAAGRMLGWRISREWLNEPDNPAAPPITMGTQYFEDLPEDAQQLIAPYLHGREIDSFFQADLWAKLGFRVLGATAIRASGDGCVLPKYLKLYANIRGWAKAIRRTEQVGLIGTSWARGTTFCPPNFDIDLTWPAITILAEAMGATPEPFFPGIPRETLELLVAKLGRCRTDWSIEEALVKEMEELVPQLTAHQYEWKSLQLMARTLSLHRQVDFAVLEVDYFRSTGRPVTPEWQRRLDDQARLRKELKALRKEVKRHFGGRNAGKHFDEWLGHNFDVQIARLKDAGAASRAFMAKAKKRYGW